MESRSDLLPLIILADSDEKFKEEIEEIENRLTSFGYDAKMVSEFPEIVELIHADEKRQVVVFISEEFRGLLGLLETVRTQMARRVAVYVLARNPQFALIDTCMEKDAYWVIEKEGLDALLLLPYIKRACKHLVAQGSAIEDELTGLDTFSVFSREIGRKLTVFNTRGYPSKASLIALDVDHLKHLNTTYGYPAVDVMLRSIAETLRHGIRPMDAVCRYHVKGDEFLIWLENLGEEDAQLKGVELQEKVEAIKASETLSISFGVAEARRGGAIDTLETLIERATGNLQDMKIAKKKLRPAA